MLKLSILGQNGYPDISVTTRMPSNAPELGWVDPSIIPATLPRRVGMIPIKLENIGSEEFVGPSQAANPDLFIKAANYPLWIFKDTIRITIETEEGDIIRENVLNVPFNMLVKADGVMRLAPGEAAYSWNNLALLDISGLPNARFNWMFFEFDPLNKIPDGYASLAVPCRFFRYQIRHSESLDIP